MNEVLQAVLLTIVFAWIVFDWRTRTHHCIRCTCKPPMNKRYVFGSLETEMRGYYDGLAYIDDQKFKAMRLLDIYNIMNLDDVSFDQAAKRCLDRSGGWTFTAYGERK